ncbi:hypothetical protein [Paraburkholderia heleia]|uniref:hypothetical protein n=1 Tax=Paraburkholderia heleia TaxID=634127 RepID=UPI003CD09248
MGRTFAFTSASAPSAHRFRILLEVTKRHRLQPPEPAPHKAPIMLTHLLANAGIAINGDHPFILQHPIPTSIDGNSRVAGARMSLGIARRAHPFGSKAILSDAIASSFSAACSATIDVGKLVFALGTTGMTNASPTYTFCSAATRNYYLRQSEGRPTRPSHMCRLDVPSALLRPESRRPQLRLPTALLKWLTHIQRLSYCHSARRTGCIKSDFCTDRHCATSKTFTIKPIDRHRSWQQERFVIANLDPWVAQPINLNEWKAGM